MSREATGDLSKGKTNQEGPSTSQATKRIPGPMNPKNPNATKDGGINRATQGRSS